MKGQHEVLTIIVITGILFGVIAAVWLWATPLIERNKELLTLKTTEDFTKATAETIKFVAKNGGKAELRMDGLDPKGSMLISNQGIEIFTTTSISLYDKNIEIPLGEMPCSATGATWGVNDSAVVCLLSAPIGQEKVRTTFSINFVPANFDNTRVNPVERRAHAIVLLPLTQSTGLDKNSLLAENRGVQQSEVNGRTVISTVVAISVV